MAEEISQGGSVSLSTPPRGQLPQRSSPDIEVPEWTYELLYHPFIAR